MATLTDIAYYLRKGIIFGAIFIVLATIAGISIVATINKVQNNQPIPTPSPAALYGRLPKIQFPESAAYPTSFDLLLIEGHPPEGTTSATIHIVPAKSPTLFSRRQAIVFAKNLGFTENPVELSTTVLQFNDAQTNSTITIDIVTNNFTLKRNVIDVSIFENKTQTSEQQLVNAARGYFIGLKTWDETLTQSKVSYFIFEGQNLVPARNARDAQVVRVDFFRDAVSNYPVVSQKYKTSNYYVVFTSQNDRVQTVLEASFQNFPPDVNNSSTYPTISGQTAWDQLVAGQGYIAVTPLAGTEAIVRRSYLAYYEPEVSQPYLQLVWVFEGDHDFVGYVPALSPEWID